MKVAIASDDGVNISQHFGRALYYIVYTIENDKVTAKEVRDKDAHHTAAGHAGGCGGHGPGGHGADTASQNKHGSMVEAALDCRIIIAGHMGGGAYHSIFERNIEPVLTDMTDPDAIIQALIEDKLENQADRLH